MQDELGGDYVLYLLEDQEEKPVAVVLPKDAAEQPLPAAQEVRPACPCDKPCPMHSHFGRCCVGTKCWHMVESLRRGDASTDSTGKGRGAHADPAGNDIPAVVSRGAVLQIGLSVLFGLATVATTLNANGVLLLKPDQLDLSPGTVLSALPGTLIFLALLGALPSRTVLQTSKQATGKFPVLCNASRLPVLPCSWLLFSVLFWHLYLGDNVAYCNISSRVQECMNWGTSWQQSRGVCSWGAPSLCPQGLDFLVGILSPV